MSPVILQQQNAQELVDLYVIGGSEPPSDVHKHPFVHTIGLRGLDGKFVPVSGLFDDGAMVNSICQSTFRGLRRQLGSLTRSSRVLRMADGTVVPSQGCWEGVVNLGGVRARGTFEVFPSGGGWSLLFGKPLLSHFCAVDDYSTDMLHVPTAGGYITLLNEHSGSVPLAEKQCEYEGHVRGAERFPSRQVLPAGSTTIERIDKQILQSDHMQRDELESEDAEQEKGDGRLVDQSNAVAEAQILTGGTNTPPARQVAPQNELYHEPVDQHETTETAHRATLLVVPPLARPIAAGLGISWRTEHYGREETEGHLADASARRLLGGDTRNPLEASQLVKSLYPVRSSQ
ncbi:hypothetical protein PLICRDRAFT_179054 [Plicaturopsis crispa FD-325 SS-3]|uniref:Uncharacterized protein n=1 Tax=Plicaturopsis crispa FD-325 SS-3 TaxID=944288 RepID=A0A0C9T8Z8_PLICR|nr:hypothetical protein PLICRDRAFT_179054 [Plicaturopsis crispa FD-325 SS-3]